jgi:hypothetical protein
MEETVAVKAVDSLGDALVSPLNQWIHAVLASSAKWDPEEYFILIYKSGCTLS